MIDFRIFRPLLAVTAVAAALMASGMAAAQTAGTRIPVGVAPVAVAVNPVTNKVYVANSGSNTISIINANTGSNTTLAVAAQPAWVAVNPETNRIYASTLTGANTAVINGSTDTVSATLATGGAGWTAVNPITDYTYVLRYGAGDEVNVLQGQAYILTSATRSYQPTALALNPVNNWLYIVHRATGDVTVLDMTSPTPYPPLKCPNGSGGFRPQPPDIGPDPGACINVPDTPVAVAVNPVTNRIYALSDVASNQISVINGSNSTFTSLTPPGTLGTAKAIAVNPVTNKIYAAFSAAVVVVDGATNAMTVVPAAGGPVAIGINVLTNMIYVPNANGTLLTIDGTSGTTSTIAIASGANAVAVNPLTNTVWVLDSGGGVTPVTGAAGTPTSTGITTTVTALPGNTSGSSGSITLNASSAMTPAPLGSVRKVYFRFDGVGPWTAATGTGPYTASFSGLSVGNHTIQAFATNGLEAPSINTDLASVPVVGNVTSYAFTVSAASIFTMSVSRVGLGTVTSSPAGINCGSDCSENYADGTVVTLTATPASGYAFTGWGGDCSGTSACQVTMNGAASITATFTASTTGELVTRYRLYSPSTYEHLYTTDVNEYNVLQSCCGWVAEGAIYRVFRGAGSYGGVAAVPYYRLYNPYSYQHHWTTDLNEYTVLPTFGWVQEGTDGYILPSQATGTLPLYRLYLNANGGLHLWTTDANEMNYLVANNGWVYEGIAGYVVPLP